MFYLRKLTNGQPRISSSVLFNLVWKDLALPHEFLECYVQFNSNIPNSC